MSKALEDVAAERARQITKERWTLKHDDKHNDRSLASAALSYTQHVVRRGWVFDNGYTESYTDEEVPYTWPESWADKWWKPKNPRRDLVRAAALIVAEIERLDRKGE